MLYGRRDKAVAPHHPRRAPPRDHVRGVSAGARKEVAPLPVVRVNLPARVFEMPRFLSLKFRRGLRTWAHHEDRVTLDGPDRWFAVSLDVRNGVHVRRQRKIARAYLVPTPSDYDRNQDSSRLQRPRHERRG